MKAKFVTITTIVLSVISVQAQVTELSNRARSTSPEYLGWDGLGSFDKDLDIKSQFGNKNIVLWTNDSSSTTKRMTILGSTGNVGIGTITPTERLEVNGNIKANGKILVANNDTVYDVLALILQLQKEVNELKQQQLVTSKN